MRTSVRRMIAAGAVVLAVAVPTAAVAVTDDGARDPAGSAEGFGPPEWAGENCDLSDAEREQLRTERQEAAELRTEPLAERDRIREHATMTDAERQELREQRREQRQERAQQRIQTDS